MKPALLVFVAFALSPFAIRAQAADLCVLTFERAGSPIAKGVDRVFAKAPSVQIKTEAKPLDFIACIESGASEIVMIVHAFKLSQDPPKEPEIRLGYFVRQPGSNPARYQPRVFFDQIFKAAEAAYLQRQRRGLPRVYKIRIMVCEQTEIREAYPALSNFAQRFGLELQFAPPSRFLSFLKGEEVTAFSRRWLAKSLQNQP